MKSFTINDTCFIFGICLMLMKALYFSTFKGKINLNYKNIEQEVAVILLIFPAKSS